MRFQEDMKLIANLLIAVIFLLGNNIKAEVSSGTSAFFFNDYSQALADYKEKPPSLSFKLKLKRLFKRHQKEAKLKKGIAIGLAVALGPFGVHRLYLGTDTKVPLIYTLTLGGGFGILPLTDIIAIIVASDMQEYANNGKVVMWIK